MVTEPLSIRHMCPDTLMGGHCSGRLTNTQRFTLSVHDIVARQGWCGVSMALRNG